jgi:DNA-binding LacI/PurR family transcriptional regulator
MRVKQTAGILSNQLQKISELSGKSFSGLIASSPMTVRPKLQEVAELAGVSLATVSRVLNAKPGVAGDTRQKVLSVLADLGYRDLPIRATRTGVVGIVTPEMDNPIFPLMAQTIEARLARKGVLAMICPATSDTVNEQEYLDHFAELDAAGVVVINGRYAAPEIGFGAYEDLRRKQIPVVLVNGLVGESPVPAVAVDIRAGSQMAVRHLASMGHRRIGVLTGPRRYATSQELIGGYAMAMSEAGLEAGSGLVSETLYTIEGGQAGVASLMEAGATGIVTSSDLMAVGAIAGIRAWGCSVPHDVSVVGFDGTSLVTFTDPPLTSVRQPVDRMAATVAWLLETPASGNGHVHMFQPDLMIGRSTGRAPS